MDLTFPRSSRLRKSDDFQRLKSGHRLGTRHLVVNFASSKRHTSRFGLVVSKRVGNAVIRNRVKRWLREAVRHEKGALDEKCGLTGFDVVLIARSSAATAGAEALREDVARALNKMGK
jgi:ribonuclease P protein component